MVFVWTVVKNHMFALFTAFFRNDLKLSKSVPNVMPKSIKTVVQKCSKKRYWFLSVFGSILASKSVPKVFKNLSKTVLFTHYVPREAPSAPQGSSRDPQGHHFGAFWCPVDDPGAPFWTIFRAKYSKLNCIANLHFKLLWHWPLTHPHPQKLDETKLSTTTDKPQKGGGGGGVSP